MQLKDVLNELEQIEIQKFIENPTLKEAIRKILLFGIYYNGRLEAGKDADPLINFALARAMNREISDEQLGRDMKISAESVIMVEDAFKQIDKFKIIKEESAPRINGAV